MDLKKGQKITSIELRKETIDHEVVQTMLLEEEKTRVELKIIKNE